jgi:hypothetical protein
MDKNHIIQEIQRTAKENDGIPLGIQRFKKETGIRYSDWFGIYWTNWSEALKEAGYKPNKMYVAYDKEFLIEQLISLIRELKGMFPTQGDLRIKRRKTESFPSHKAFRRLGSKSERAKEILSYCENKSGYEDIIDCCKEVCDTSKEKIEYDSGDTETQMGFVYLMKSGRYYKIGRSTCVEKRNYEIGIKLPEELKVMHKIKTDDPIGIEAYWHNRFQEKRKGGEWFDLSSSDIKAFKRRKFQ